MRSIEAVAAANPHTIVTLTGGGGMDTRRWLDKVPALLDTYYPGQEGASERKAGRGTGQTDELRKPGARDRPRSRSYRARSSFFKLTTEVGSPILLDLVHDMIEVGVIHQHAGGRLPPAARLRSGGFLVFRNSSSMEFLVSPECGSPLRRGSVHWET